MAPLKWKDTSIPSPKFETDASGALLPGAQGQSAEKRCETLRQVGWSDSLGDSKYSSGQQVSGVFFIDYLRRLKLREVIKVSSDRAAHGNRRPAKIEELQRRTGRFLAFFRGVTQFVTVHGILL